MELISHGRTLVAGNAKGELLSARWGSASGAVSILERASSSINIIPLCGESLAGRVLAIPSGRGSCSGSGVLLELILNGHAPAAIVICEREEILTLGALVAEVVFEQSIPCCGWSGRCSPASATTGTPEWRDPAFGSYTSPR